MNFQEKIITFFALSALADKLNIKENELINTEKQNKKFEKVLEENEGVFKDKNKDVLKQGVINLVNKYVNKLSDTKKKENKKGG